MVLSFSDGAISNMAKRNFVNVRVNQMNAVEAEYCGPYCFYSNPKLLEQCDLITAMLQIGRGRNAV